MANHESAVKAHRQSLERRERNRQYRSRLRRALKAFRTAVDDGRADDAKSSLSETVSMIDKLAGKGIIHRNAASRYKSRLVKRLTTTAPAGA